MKNLPLLIAGAAGCGMQVLPEVLQQQARLDDPTAAARRDFIKCESSGPCMTCCCSLAQHVLNDTDLHLKLAANCNDSQKIKTVDSVLSR